MGLFHDEDDLRPFRQFGSHRGVGVRGEAGGCDFQAWLVGEDLFGGGAAQAVGITVTLYEMAGSDQSTSRIAFALG